MSSSSLCLDTPRSSGGVFCTVQNDLNLSVGQTANQYQETRFFDEVRFVQLRDV
jgi:hypothetical protein